MCSFSLVSSLCSKWAGRKYSKVDGLFRAYHLGISRWSSHIDSVSDATLQFCGFPANWDFCKLSLYIINLAGGNYSTFGRGEVTPSPILHDIMTGARSAAKTPLVFRRSACRVTFKSTICLQYSQYIFLHCLQGQQKMNKLSFLHFLVLKGGPTLDIFFNRAQ